MQWKSEEKNESVTFQLASRIYQDILLSLESYYDDSFVVKFFLPEEISEESKVVAASFALVLYSPSLTMKEVVNSRIYYIYYLSVLYGAQIFLKEYANTKQHKPYAIKTDKKTIEDIKNSITDTLGGEYTITPAAQMVMDIYKEQVAYTKKKAYMHIKGKKFNPTDYERCLQGALVWGYLFAREMIDEGK